VSERRQFFSAVDAVTKLDDQYTEQSAGSMCAEVENQLFTSAISHAEFSSTFFWFPTTTHTITADVIVSISFQLW